MTPRVVIADGTAFIRLAVRTALLSDGIEVVGEAESPGGLRSLLRNACPDVVLLDQELDPDMSIVGWACDELPGTAVVVLTVDASTEVALHAVRAGACGVAPKDTPPERLPAIVRGVVDGEAAIPRKVVRRMLGQMRRPGARARGAAADALSPREAEVLGCVSRGLSDHDIARMLGISEVTVRRHVAGAMLKLGAANRDEALVHFAAGRSVEPVPVPAASGRAA